MEWLFHRLLIWNHAPEPLAWAWYAYLSVRVFTWFFCFAWYGGWDGWRTQRANLPRFAYDPYTPSALLRR